MQHITVFRKTALAVATLIACCQANAAGFQLNEFSAVGLGRAYAGEAAMGDTAASASRNPATMALMPNSALSVGGIFVDPSVDIDGTSASGNSLQAKSIADAAIVPNIHFVQPLSDSWWVGASATTNYGLTTHYSDQYIAGPLAGKTLLKTYNLNLSTAWRMNDHLSFGVGADAVYAEAEINRTAGEAGKLLGLSRDQQLAHLKGDRWGYGWNAGILYEVDDRNRFGFTYRSEVKIKFKGHYSSDVNTAYNNVPSIKQMGIYGTSGQSIPGKLDLTLPEVWEVSGWHNVAPKWDVHYSMAYTNWNSFQELRAIGNDGQTLLQKDEKYKGAWRMALGTTYRHDDRWTFRGGIAFDESPAQANYRSISIPDQDRVWLTAGTSYKLNDNASVDLGLAYMHGKNVTIKEGNYTFTSKGTAWLYGAGFNYKF